MITTHIKHKRNVTYLVSIILTLSFLLLLTADPYAAAAPSISFQFGGYFLGDGAVGTPPVIITVTDPAANLNSTAKDTVQVHVTSTTDPTGITLNMSETNVNTGVFKNTDLIFMKGNYQFSVGNTVTVTTTDYSANTSSTVINQLSLKAVSSSSHTGISVSHSETGVNTGVFSGKITFTNSTSSGNSLHVVPGDIFSITDLVSGLTTNGLIIPNTNSTVGAIRTNIGDIVTATYGLVSSSITVGNDEAAPGGGGGGLIRPGLVLDFIQALGIGGSPHIVTPPSFGGGLFHYDDGLAIIQNNIKKTFDISKYNQEIPHQVLVANQPVNMTFKIYENYNPNAIIHSGLYFIPRGNDMITPNSIAHIIYEKNKPVEVSDPGKLLTNVLATFKTNGMFEYITFQFTPTRSYDKMSFLDRTWNDHRYSTDVRIHDGAAPASSMYTLPDGVLEYGYSDFITKLDTDGYYKPQIMAHIHNTNDVFGTQDSGHVYWLYNTTDQSVTLDITDKKRNTLYSSTEKLVKKSLPVHGDYNFMKYTEQQLNRWDVIQEQKIMERETLKAIEHASIKYPGYPFSKW